MAEIKVLALDLDGTLTNSQKEVTPRTRAALDAAIAKGVTIVLASGRPTAGVLPLAKELFLVQSLAGAAVDDLAAVVRKDAAALFIQPQFLCTRNSWMPSTYPSCAPLPPHRT